MKIRREVVAACAALALAACSAAAAVSPGTSADPVPTGTVGGVGVLPPTVETPGASPAGPERTEPEDTEESESDAEDPDSSMSGTTTTTRPPRTGARSTSSTAAPAVPLLTVGEQVMGNKVLMIGDSILASTARRYGNNMCRALEPLGWQVEVEAEVSREITFGNRVLRSRLEAGWDAALILLGNNYGQKPNVFMSELNKMLLALAPRPVLLLTVTEFELIQSEVNDIIRSVGSLYPNVTVVDWATMSTFPGVLSADGLHLTDDGREFLAQVVAPYFGTAPVPPGDCLSSKFHDDSAGSINGPSNPKPSGNKPTSTTVRPTSTPTTVRPTSTPTTVRPTSTPTTVRPTSSSAPASSTPLQTSPPPPPTSLPQQSVPVTLPQQTSPPQQTAPPQTSPPETLPVTVPVGG